MEGTNSKPTIKVSYMYISKCGLVQKNQDLIILTFTYIYVLVAVGWSGILKGKQKLGVTFNSDKLGSIDFTKFSKLTMCSA